MARSLWRLDAGREPEELLFTSAAAGFSAREARFDWSIKRPVSESSANREPGSASPG